MSSTSGPQQHIRIAALLTLITGVLALFPAVVLILVSAGFMAAGSFGTPDGTFPGLLAGGILGLVALFFAITAIPSIVAGFGLMARKPWARPLTIVLGIINLFFFPVGTIIGAYQLWVLAVNDETRAAYAAGAMRAGSYHSTV